jgi:hypothetical protein
MQATGSKRAKKGARHDRARQSGYAGQKRLQSSGRRRLAFDKEFEKASSHSLGGSSWSLSYLHHLTGSATWADRTRKKTMSFERTPLSPTKSDALSSLQLESINQR